MQQSYSRSLAVQLFAHPVQGKYRDPGIKPLVNVILGEIWRKQGVSRAAVGTRSKMGKPGSCLRAFMFITNHKVLFFCRHRNTGRK